MREDFSRTGFCMALYVILQLLVGMVSVRLISLLVLGVIYFSGGIAGAGYAGGGGIQGFLDMMTAPETSQYVSIIPGYVFVIPFVIRLLNGRVFNADEGRELKDISVVGLTCAFFILFFFGVIGNIMGQGIVLLYESLGGYSLGDVVVEGLSQRSPALLFIFTVIITPLFEEILYRYGIISRIRSCGERQAVIFSAVIFSLGHKNLFQLFYTFFAGIIFGYIYVYTGKLRYSFMLHAMFNFFGAFVPMVLSGNAGDVSTYSKAYTAVEYGMAFVGLIIFIGGILKKKFSMFEIGGRGPGGTSFKDMYINPGFLSYFILCSVLSIFMMM